MRVGVLTGGGDCQGLNAVLRAVVLTHPEHEVTAYLDGWRGVLENATRTLRWPDVRDLLSVGGTVIGSSRTNPLKKENGLELARANLTAVDGLVAIGGDDTLSVAKALAETGFPTVGVPKTIDNDLDATDLTFGYTTAVQIATEALDRLRTTALSHGRIVVCEVMGRHAGWIAYGAGIAGGADAVLVPEETFSVDALAEHLAARRAAGARAAIVVVAEGAAAEGGDVATSTQELDAFGHVRLGGVGEQLAAELERRTGWEARHAQLGHIQRGGDPVAFDRVLATRFGVVATDALLAGESGVMASARGTEVTLVPLGEAVAANRVLGAAELEFLRRVTGFPTTRRTS